MVRLNIASILRSGNISISVRCVLKTRQQFSLGKKEGKKDTINCDYTFIYVARARNKFRGRVPLKGAMLYCEEVKVLQCGLGASREYCVMYCILYCFDAKRNQARGSGLGEKGRERVLM